MNSTVRVAAFGALSVAAVRQYRVEVIAEARRRGLPLVSEAPSDLDPDLVGDRHVIDTDIRLIVLDGPCGAGTRLRWNPVIGWCVARPGSLPDRRRFALAAASPLDLAPPAPAVLAWVIQQLHNRRSGAVKHRLQSGSPTQLAM